MAQITMADLKPCDKWNILNLPLPAQWKNFNQDYIFTAIATAMF